MTNSKQHMNVAFPPHATSNMSATLTSSSVLNEAFTYICQRTVRLCYNSVVIGFGIYPFVNKFGSLGFSAMVGDSVISDSSGWEPAEWTMLSDVFCHLFQLPEQAFVLVHLLGGSGVSGCICCGCCLPTSFSSWHLSLDAPEVVELAKYKSHLTLWGQTVSQPESNLHALTCLLNSSEQHFYLHQGWEWKFR